MKYFLLCCVAVALCSDVSSQAVPVEHVAHVVEVPPATTASTTMKPVHTSSMAPITTKTPVMTTPPMDKCELECTKLEYDPICSSNGRCLHQFPNKCVMDTFTCRNPKLDFKAVDEKLCHKPTMRRCMDNDLKGGE